MNITQEGNQFKKLETVESLQHELKLLNQTIDKLNNKRVEILTKIYKLKNKRN
jgi:uncharacterized protein YfkK (UPF0435 family)